LGGVNFAEFKVIIQEAEGELPEFAILRGIPQHNHNFFNSILCYFCSGQGLKQSARAL